MAAHKTVRSQRAFEIGRLTIVEWLDAMGTISWTDPEDITAEPGSCESVGRLLSVNKSVICVASNKCRTNGRVDHVMTIPRGCVVSVRQMRE